MIEVGGVTFRYANQKEPAIRDLSFVCESRGITALVGGSGIGKSTLMALLAGIYLSGDDTMAEYQGRVRIGDRDPGDLRGPSLVSWVPQQPVLLDHLDVVGNVLLPARIVPGISDAQPRCAELLAELGLEAASGLRPRELSGGMRTRVSLARALITKPMFLFLDEPFSSLDLGNRWNLYAFLRHARQSRDLVTVLTTHNIPEAMLVCDRVALMSGANGQTIVRITDNDPPAMTGVASEALAAARRLAASVETSLFLPV